MQANFDVLFGEFECLGSFGSTELFHVTQHEHGVVGLRERENSGFEHALGLRRSGLLLGVGHIGWKHHVFSWRVGARIESFIAAPPIGSRQGLVHGNTSQPGGELGPTGKLVEVLIGAYVSILHNILGFGILAKDGARHAIKPLVVAPHQDFK